MARNTSSKPATASTDTDQPAQAAAASPAETAAQERAAETEQRQETAEQAQSVADDQRADIAAGGTGELPADKAELAKGHSVSDPKAAPVDYAVQTARKTAQRILPPDAASADAMSRAPLANLPYGSEPRSFDPGTGLAPVPEADKAEAVHGDDQDADVDRGASAATRAASAE